MIEKEVVLNPCAKINLYLKILGKRKDGYHELCTVMHPIALFDTISIKHTNGEFVVQCQTEGLPTNQNPPQEEDNIVTKAAKLFFEHIGKKPSVHIKIVKRIPMSGGLGGGSSDAAYAVMGLNKLYGNILKKEDMMNICSAIGMDVPFFTDTRPAICGGRGEIIKERFNNLHFFCVLINPGKGVATKEAYDIFNLGLTDLNTQGSIFDSVFMEDALRFKKVSKMRDVAGLITNDLEQPAIKICPEIKNILEMLKNAGAVKSFVCGSGSTVCGMTESIQSAEEVKKRAITMCPPEWWVKVVPSLA